ncbi:hypothetical protein X772_28715 [Mesorhizobium sp. LSJC280B00]|nr:hypothetical protein X772_28715 [Mesorhizobium sp. LSJC280B00]
MKDKSRQFGVPTMTINRRLFNQFLLLAGASAALPAGAFAEDAKPVAGGTLNFVYYPEPNQIVSINTSAGGPATIGPKIFDGLLAYDYDLNPRPQLATEWSISDDGLEYVFKLRQGVKFSDGHDLTSEDVAFSISRLREAHPRGRITFQNVTDIDTSDPYIVKIKLSKPSAALISGLAATESPVVPKHIYEKLKPADDPSFEQIIGSGPFVLKEWVKGSHILVEKNPTYWDALNPISTGSFSASSPIRARAPRRSKRARSTSDRTLWPSPIWSVSTRCRNSSSTARSSPIAARCTN